MQRITRENSTSLTCAACEWSLQMNECEHFWGKANIKEQLFELLLFLLFDGFQMRRGGGGELKRLLLLFLFIGFQMHCIHHDAKMLLDACIHHLLMGCCCWMLHQHLISHCTFWAADAVCSSMHASASCDHIKMLSSALLGTEANHFDSSTWASEPSETK